MFTFEHSIWNRVGMTMGLSLSHVINLCDKGFFGTPSSHATMVMDPNDPLYLRNLLLSSPESLRKL